MAFMYNNGGDWTNNQTFTQTNGDTNNWISNSSTDYHANFVSGNMTTGTSDRVLAIFIDSDYNVDSNVMPVITSGFPAKLQNLTGMIFDSCFTPDKAILLSVGSPADCWINFYHIDFNSD